MYQTKKGKKRKCKPKILFLKQYNYDEWLRNINLTDKKNSNGKKILSDDKEKNN